MEMWYELIGQYGYVAIFALLTLGIIGLPVPDEILLTYLGYVTSIGTMNFLLTFSSALIGAICGISISYVLGIKMGEPFLKKYGAKLFIKEKTINRTNTLFHKYGSYLLFFCYFIPGVRHIAAYVGGISRYPFKQFALFAYAGSFVWVMGFLLLGNQLGGNWDLIYYFIHKYIWGILIFSLVVAGIYIAYRFQKQSMS